MASSTLRRAQENEIEDIAKTFKYPEYLEAKDSRKRVFKPKQLKPICAIM